MVGCLCLQLFSVSIFSQDLEYECHHCHFLSAHNIFMNYFPHLFVKLFITHTIFFVSAMYSRIYDVLFVLLQELAVNSPNERNWRGIFIALLVIIAVLGLIVFSIVLVSPPEEGPRLRGRKPTLEEVLGKLPSPARFNGTWISGNWINFITNQ